MDSKFEKSNEIYFRLGIIYKQQLKYEQALDVREFQIWFNLISQCFKYILQKPPRPLTQGDIWFQIGHVYELQKDVLDFVFFIFSYIYLVHKCKRCIWTSFKRNAITCQSAPTTRLVIPLQYRSRKPRSSHQLPNALHRCRYIIMIKSLHSNSHFQIQATAKHGTS